MTGLLNALGQVLEAGGREDDIIYLNMFAIDGY